MDSDKDLRKFFQQSGLLEKELNEEIEAREKAAEETRSNQARSQLPMLA